MDKIICLGKNYESHIKEMNEGKVEKPLLFIKPPSVIATPKNQGSLVLPWDRGEIHYECEIVFKLYKKNIIGLGLGLDLTLRDLQKELKSKGHPWECAKTFKNSAVLTQIHAVKEFPKNWQDTPFSLIINGEVRQSSQLSSAILKADEIIHYVNNYFPICDGDLIFTGTPEGVGPLRAGDSIEMIFGPIHHKFELFRHG